MKKKASLNLRMLLLSGTKVLTSFMTLITAMLLARFRTLEEYGTYSSIMLVITIVTTIIELGLPNGINYFIGRADNDNERRRFISTFYSLCTLLSAFTGLLLVVCVPLIVTYFKNPQIRDYIYFIGIVPWTTIITSSAENLLVASNKTKQLLFYRSTYSVLIVGIILVVQYTGMSFSDYMAFYVVVQVIFALLVYLIAFNLFGRIKLKIDWLLVKKIFSFTIPLGLSSAAGNIKKYTDNLVIGYFCDTEQLALYSNAAKELPLMFISASITAVLLPIVAKLMKNNRPSDALKLWNEATIISFFFNCFFGIGLFTFSYEAVLFLYSEKYAAGASVFAIYSLLIIIRSVYYGLLLNSSGHSRLILYSTLIACAVNIVADVVMYKIVGFIGPAIATIVVSIVNAYLQMKFTKKCFGIKLRIMLPWKEMFYMGIVNACLACIFYCIKVYFPLETYLTTTGEAIFLAVVWFIIDLLIFFRMLKESWSKLKSYKE